MKKDAIVRLMVLDIDGCMTKGFYQPYNLEIINTLKSYNLRAKIDRAFPALTVCSGRPQPYVEAVLQMLEGYYPAIAEHGGLLCDIKNLRIEPNPIVPPGYLQEIYQLKAGLQKAKTRGVHYFVEPGKETQLTIFPRGNTSIDDIAAIVQSVIDETGMNYNMHVSPRCINIFPEGLHKGQGIDWLSSVCDIPLENMAGIGDTEHDKLFLSQLGFPATVKNGNPMLHEIPDCYISKQEDIEGVLDFYNRCVDHNEKIIKS